MQPNQIDHAGESRLRFVFDHAVVSCGLAADATVEDIAWTLGELTPLYPGNPIAIYVTLPAGKRKSGRARSK
jgi:hypothetical protein